MLMKDELLFIPSLLSQTKHQYDKDIPPLRYYKITSSGTCAHHASSLSGSDSLDFCEYFISGGSIPVKGHVSTCSV